MMRLRRGYSFFELLVVLTFIGLIARIAVPRFGDMKRRAIAAKIIGDVHAIRVATLTYYTEKTSWPAEVGPGIVPSEIVPHLPRNFTFVQPDYMYDYEDWSLSAGLPGNPELSSMIGVSVTTTDPNLALQLVKTAGRGFAPFSSGNRVTFFLAGAQGN
jgi:type II secretory pathway pseudopilin PulG